MTVLYEAKNSFWLGTQATVIRPDSELAWAEKYVQTNAAYSWVLGKFVEANNANSNRQYFSLDGLRMAQPTIAHAPMNINHAPRRIVGAYVATEMLYPIDGEPAFEGTMQNPYVEALGVFWKHYFPEEYAIVQMASDTGNLFFSMECVPSSLKCDGMAGCGQQFAYDGRYSPDYCDHLNHPTNSTIKHLIDPHFTGGALIVPPEKPGWKKASVDQLSLLIEENAKEAEMAYEGIKEEFSQLSPQAWESMMIELVALAESAKPHPYTPPPWGGRPRAGKTGMGGTRCAVCGKGPQSKIHIAYSPPGSGSGDTPVQQARQFTAEQRKTAAQSGKAMPDGSYPILNTSDLKNAIQAIGRASNKDAVKRHIIKRAKALKATNLLPADWQ